MNLQSSSFHIQFFDMFHVFPPGLHSIQNSKIPNTTPLTSHSGKWPIILKGVKLKFPNTSPPDFLGTWKIFDKFPVGSLLQDPKKEYVGNMKKYVKNMKKYDM